MNHRAFGRTGLRVSEVGFGGWGISQADWVGADDRESLAALDRAIGLGVDFVDTALAYGDGHSEELIGEAARRSETTVHVATKVPPKTLRWPGRGEDRVEEVFPGDWIRSCVEGSLRNLGRDAIELLQLHVWHDAWLDRGDWCETVLALKGEGKVRFFGVSANDHEPDTALELVRSGRVDSVQVVYNVFEQSPASELFPAALEQGVGVIARSPFDEGGLTGRIDGTTEFPEGDWRREYFRGERKREVAERLRSLADDLDVAPDEVPELALRFVLSAEAVSTVIPGMRSIRNVERNCAAADAGALPGEVVSRLRRHHWGRNWYVYD